MIYLDYNASTPVDTRVLKYVEQNMQDLYANPSSLHEPGRKTKNIILKTKQVISEFINCDKTEIIFSSGATESNNLAIQGCFFKQANKTKNKILVSKSEHPSVIKTCEYLKKRFNAVIEYIPVNSDGIIKLTELDNLIDDRTLMVIIMYVNNETGVVQPISEISEIINKYKQNSKLFWLCDAVQAAGKCVIDVKKYNIDFLSLSAHKIYGFKGTGILFKNKNIEIEPLIYGGGQEFEIRAGTENIPGILSMKKAVELCISQQKKDNEHFKKLHGILLNKINDKIGKYNINGDIKNKVYNTLNISFSGMDNQTLLMLLDLENICVSIGSACNAGTPKKSEVLKAMNIKKDIIDSSIRISFGRFTTETEIIEFVDKLKNIIKPK